MMIARLSFFTLLAAISASLDHHDATSLGNTASLASVGLHVDEHARALDKMPATSPLLRRETDASAATHSPGSPPVASQIEHLSHVESDHHAGADAHEPLHRRLAEAATFTSEITSDDEELSHIGNSVGSNWGARRRTTLYVCMNCQGLLTTKHNQVRAIKDRSDCAGDIKSLNADLSANPNPLITCAQMVEDDAECGDSFVMRDTSFACACYKGTGTCTTRVNMMACAYRLEQPVCADTVNMETAGTTPIYLVRGVYPNAMVDGCNQQLILSGNYGEGVKTCANAVAANDECSRKFQWARDGTHCSCLKKPPAAPCAMVDSGEICSYELLDKIDEGSSSSSSFDSVAPPSEGAGDLGAGG